MFVKFVNVYGDVSVTIPCGSSLRIYAETPGGDGTHLELAGMLLGCMLARRMLACRPFACRLTRCIPVGLVVASSEMYSGSISGTHRAKLHFAKRRVE